MVELETDRLILRQWKKSDYSEFAKLTSDPLVMKFFPRVLTKTDSDQLASKIETLIKDNGWGFWAVELKSTSMFIGFIGLHYQDLDIPNAPFVEIGWRLSSNQWGFGYASEAAKRALKYAFEELSTTSVYAFTTIKNLPSKSVMTRIGMVDTNQDFNHPNLSNYPELVRHSLYRISADMWRQSIA